MKNNTIHLLLLLFLTFNFSACQNDSHYNVTSLDTEMQDTEDFEEYLSKAKNSANSENFSLAHDYLEKARKLGVSKSQLSKAKQYVANKKEEYRERQRRIEQERQRRLAMENQNTGDSSSSYYAADDLKNMCLGSSGAYKSFCYNIDNSDLKNTCLGMTDYPDFCYNIGNSDMKNYCLAASGQYPDFCYNIGDTDLKNACLGSTRGSDFCFSIHDSNLKSMCLGITNTSNNCYNIR